MPWPDRKVFAGGVAGLATWAAVWAASRFGFVVDPALATALVPLVSSVIGYITPPSQRDILKRLNDELVKIAQDDPSIPVTKP